LLENNNEVKAVNGISLNEVLTSANLRGQKAVIVDAASAAAHRPEFHFIESKFDLYTVYGVGLAQRMSFPIEPEVVAPASPTEAAPAPTQQTNERNVSVLPHVIFLPFASRGSLLSG
jgi:hypothetical protein